MNFWQNSVDNVLKEVGSNKLGLTEREVQLSLKRYGSNNIEKQKKVSVIARFFAQFKNIMIIVLLVSAFISLTLALVKGEYGDLIESGIIFFIVIVNSIIGVVQEKRAEDSLALLAQKTAKTALVLRKNGAKRILSSEVVVGDIVELAAGDFVPADIRLIDSQNLKCDESILTGESHAVFKNANFVGNALTPLAERENMCLAGTNVTFGSGKGVVVSVGENTQMGKIAKILNKSIKEKSPLEKNIDKIGKIITIGVLAIVLVVFIVELIFSSTLSIFEAFLIAIALAVAAIPESLPAVITIIMALGVERLAKQGAIVKTLGAVETLGCCNVICSDKTGTLTQNDMQVKHIFSNGIIFNEDEFKPESNNYLMMGIKFCNNAKISDKKIIGDATETSLLKFCEKKGNSFISERIFEIPFNSTSKTMTTINKVDNKLIAFSKGALDYLIDGCDFVYENGFIRPINQEDKKAIINSHNILASSGERVLAVSMQYVNDEKSAKNTQFLAKNNVFLGFLGIFDPPRRDVKATIESCAKAGLKTIMITGDHPDTAFSVAKEIGIAKSRSEVLLGKELEKMSDKELKNRITNYSVFCRVTPEDKVKIVKALKSCGKIVAMTGDGVNDAPSLKVSDIGTSMGSGTDVTKSVADLILTDNKFSTIVVAIKEGRTIFNNIQKTLQFLISTNAVEVLGIFITALLLKNAVFLLPSQILFINLITDSLPAFALGLEPSEKDVLNYPPRDSKTSLFSGEIGTGIIYQAFVQTLVVLVMFVISNAKLGNAVASTMVFLTICYMQIIHAVNCKTTKSLTKINIFANKAFNISFVVLFGLITMVGLISPLQAAFNIVPLTLGQWGIVALCSASIIPVVEISKFFMHHKFGDKKLAYKNLKIVKN